MRRRKTIKLAVAMAVLYLFFPFIAGLLAIGDRDGPKIYSQTYHTILYRIGYKFMHDEKPRQNIELDRPWFYGFPRHRRPPIYDQQ